MRKLKLHAAECLLVVLLTSAPLDNFCRAEFRHSIHVWRPIQELHNPLIRGRLGDQESIAILKFSKTIKSYSTSVYAKKNDNHLSVEFYRYW